METKIYFIRSGVRNVRKYLTFSTYFSTFALMSISVLDKSKPKSPKFVYKEPPAFLTHGEKESYWRGEVDRWREGYKGLTGFQYFYLTQWWFQDNSQGGGFKAIRPVWRQDDEDLIFKPIDKCFDDYWDFMLYKRRECGWSSILSALYVWKGLTNIGVVMGYTSADVDRIVGFMNKKLRYGLERMKLPEDVIPLRWHMPASKNTNELKIWDDYNPKDISIMSSYETVVNPKAFEGDRLALIGLDEIAIHGKIDKVMGSADASRMAGQVRTGLIFAGGTAGTISVDARKVLLSKFEKSKELEIYVSFYLGYHGLFQGKDKDGKVIDLTVNGYTDHKKAIECIEYRRETLYKSGDMTAFNEYCGAYPLDKDEIFSAIDESKLPEDIKISLQNQNKIILMNEAERETRLGKEERDIFKRGSFLEINGTVQFVENKSGRWHIGFHANKNHRYIGGSDPIQFNSASRDGSDFVFAIKNYDLQRYDAFYIARLDDPETVHREVSMGQIYYNNAPNMLEMEQGGTIMNEYKKSSQMHLLADSPHAIGIKFTHLPNNKGFKAKALKDTGGGYVLGYFRNHHDKIFFKPIIEQAFKWGTGANLDIMDAMSATEIYDKNIHETEVRNKKPKNKEVTYWGVENGVKVLKTIKIME